MARQKACLQETSAEAMLRVQDFPRAFPVLVGVRSPPRARAQAALQKALRPQDSPR